VALVGSYLSLVPACGGTPIEPNPTAGLPLPAGGGDQPPPPASTHPLALIGSWRGVVTGLMPSTVQTITWRFDPDGACLESFLSITDGIENSSDRPCTWTATSTTITVSYAGVGMAITFDLHYSFPSPDVLRLDSDEFSRVG
jgi:hypothetical protein